MNGVTFAGGSDFAGALAPLLDVMSDLHWDIHVQGSIWTPERHSRPGNWFTSPADAYWVPSARLYRAGILPRLAGELCTSDWSYYIGYPGSIEEAADARRRSSCDATRGRWVRMAPPLFGLYIACLTPSREGEWIVASPEEAWLDRLRSHQPCRPYDLMQLAPRPS